ncbi:SnoaL-like domain-containing protein [Streptomyces sp. 3213]|uniref:nuclear transport factor 2 family protein n=1 Tax=Streptomyces sp. 3213.3 TaxID=1855348 RepID=UPI00089A050D|nr:nuclear transport factor 2 family protein [Streptomyces sp. 3213.3]SEF04358.1 SnoaL-like domain-containing protein [Streptomyces sp. 3213] [Streptomyces sp. 3213.3]
MIQTTETVIDRYIRIFDRLPHDPGALEELRTVYAPDATVQLDEGGEMVTGIDAILPIYRDLAARMADSHHFWDVTELDDGTLECRWASLTRTADGRLLTLNGLERATVNSDGLITSLRNKMVPPDSRIYE